MKQNNKFKYLYGIIDAVKASIYWKSTEGLYLGCNKYMLDMAGVTNRQNILGKKDIELPWKNEAEIIEKIDTQVITTGKEYQGEEAPTLANKQKRIFLTTKTPLLDDNGNVSGLIGVSMDITDRKLIEKKLKKAKNKAEIANKLKSEFIHNMEHDIRTPSSGIMRMLEILESQEENKKKKEVLNHLVNASRQLYSLLNDIVAFDKIEKGNLPIFAKIFDLKKLISEVIYVETPAAKFKNLELIIKYPEDVHHIFVSDEFRIKRILLNLISNAIKFTSKGSIKISVQEIEQVDNRNVILAIIVEDTGIGIPKDKLDLIYEKFTRVSPANKELYIGAGLGLKIVKNFVEDLEGEINANSEIDKGTTFTIILPIKISLLKHMN